MRPRSGSGLRSCLKSISRNPNPRPLIVEIEKEPDSSKKYTKCPWSLIQFYIACCYIRMDRTSLTYSTPISPRPDQQQSRLQKHKTSALCWWTVFCKTSDTIQSMVPIWDGSSEIGAHVSNNICYLICVSHLIRSWAVNNWIIFLL